MNGSVGGPLQIVVGLVLYRSPVPLKSVPVVPLNPKTHRDWLQRGERAWFSEPLVRTQWTLPLDLGASDKVVEEDRKDDHQADYDGPLGSSKAEQNPRSNRDMDDTASGPTQTPPLCRRKGVELGLCDRFGLCQSYSTTKGGLP